MKIIASLIFGIIAGAFLYLADTAAHTLIQKAAYLAGFILFVSLFAYFFYSFFQDRRWAKNRKNNKKGYKL